MTTNQFPFKVLFCFENESQIVIEIKRTDIQSEDKSLVYKWLNIQNEKQNEDTTSFSELRSVNEELIKPLTFQSMEQVGEEQTRNFAEGTLIWNANQASFNEETMTQVKPADVSVECLAAIADFLACN